MNHGMKMNPLMKTFHYLTMDMEESKMKKLANLKLASLCIQGKEESWNEIKLERRQHYRHYRPNQRYLWVLSRIEREGWKTRASTHANDYVITVTSPICSVFYSRRYQPYGYMSVPSQLAYEYKESGGMHQVQGGTATREANNNSQTFFNLWLSINDWIFFPQCLLCCD